jgi:hypothetical protein
MNKTLKDATLEELYAEIKKRELKGHATKEDKEYAEIKSINQKGWTTAKMCVVYGKSDYDDMPFFMFNFLEGDKKLDAYYDNHGLEFEEVQEFIPSGFAEAMENSYEIRRDKGETYEQVVARGIEILKKCGYTHFEEYKDE